MCVASAVGVLISGGNVDLPRWHAFLQSEDPPLHRDFYRLVENTDCFPSHLFANSGFHEQRHRHHPPLVQHKLTLMRKKDASTNSFRRLLGELSTLMAYEVTRDMPLQDVQIGNPAGDHDRQDDRRQEAGARLHPARRQRLSGRHAQRGARRPVATSACTATRNTLQPVEYYFKMPSEMDERDIIVVDHAGHRQFGCGLRDRSSSSSPAPSSSCACWRA